MTANTDSNRPRVLIEDWLPITELGIESRRERAVSTTLPPLNRLHVWWARRPLAASAAVVAAGLLPSWSQRLADRFREHPEVQTETAYRRWVLDLVGIWGDPITGKARIDAAKAAGIKLQGNGYGYKQAYKNPPRSGDLQLFHLLLVATWGSVPDVLDPTAGGGSIPFVAARLGLPTHANDLNPIAASLLTAGVQIPARFGDSLSQLLREWGTVLTERVGVATRPYFPRQAGEDIIAYVWANAIRCPRTGRWVPLMGDKWLRKGAGKEVAVHVHTERDGQECLTPWFEVRRGSSVDYADANSGFVSGGSALSPYDDLTIDGTYIKSEAKAGRMKPLLYAIAYRDAKGKRDFRTPDETDYAAIQAANERFEEVKDEWTDSGFLPGELIPDISNYERGHRMYGINTWLDMFTPRQALVHGAFAMEFAKLVPEVRAALGDELGDAVLCELGLLQGKALNWNARSSTWDVSRQKMRSVFEKHNFSFKWTFAEFEGSDALYPWTLHVVDNYEQISYLLYGRERSLLAEEGPTVGPVSVTQGSAADIDSVEPHSVAHICIDPPYYDNVMYAELSDFFYVWEKHTLGLVRPEFFVEEMTDKENEAVANPARFAEMDKRKKELATLDYQSKMTSIFAECRRVLRDDGVMTVMFTHKRADAWDTLGAGLLDAGFTIQTSWPVNTESETSSHQAKMNSAGSTIMLVCRKRAHLNASRKVFLEDIAGDIRSAARDAVTTFRAQGIDGVDLLLSTYGPVLSVISEHWPVYSMTATDDGSSQLVRPEEALDLAREEVLRLQRARIVGHDIQIDAHTDFVLMAWETFKAPEFPFDEARRLALAIGGLDVKELERAKILSASGGKVRLVAPKERLRRAGGDDDTGVRLDASRFAFVNDAVDTVLFVGSVDGFGQAKQMMDRLRLTDDPKFIATLQGLVNAIPRTRVNGQWVVPQAGLLDTLVTAYFPDVEVPPDPVLAAEVEQGSLFDESTG